MIFVCYTIRLPMHSSVKEFKSYSIPFAWAFVCNGIRLLVYIRLLWYAIGVCYSAHLSWYQYAIIFCLMCTRLLGFSDTRSVCHHTLLLTHNHQFPWHDAICYIAHVPLYLTCDNFRFIHVSLHHNPLPSPPPLPSPNLLLTILYYIHNYISSVTVLSAADYLSVRERQRKKCLGRFSSE